MNDIQILFDEPWIVGGDFNAILFQPERNKPEGCLASRKFFKKFVKQHSLIDLPPNGGKFTWTNSQQHPLLIRLDRFLVNGDFQDHCPSLMQMRLKRPIFDHCPIMMNCNSVMKPVSPFRFDNYLLFHPSFLDNMKLWWASLVFSGRPSFVFAKKLQGLKVLIKARRKSLGDLQIQLDYLEKEIDVIDYRKWGQRSKGKWSKDDERNTRYVHQLASYKSKLNNINCLRIDGDLSYDKSKISAEDVNFYSNFFSEQFPTWPRFDELQMPSIPVEDNIQLEKPFSEEEVKNVIWHFGANKAPERDKKGDPISPFLLILVVEILSLMIKKAASSGLISGFKISSNGTSVQHLQFVDDLIVLLDDTAEQVSI
ncbi:uncharacterized protein LOC113295777 [Papaver somniferum]|uniref:uncharacterized protein LOC113295777 n=1 Tax=Papaver somniferum TaxID=3469 RepID=UPI000E6FA220|nr:uncharacterized protein LOC113295777 [Papaver somniferum]